MRLQYKITGILALAFLVPVLILGTGGYLSIKRTGHRAADHSGRALLAAEELRLRDSTRASALDIEQLCGTFEVQVQHISARLVRTRTNLALYHLDQLSNRYPNRDTAGLPAYGYVHPVYGAYADFDNRGWGGPWVPRPVLARARHDEAFRARIADSLHTVMLLDGELVEAQRHNRRTLDLAWIVLADGVTNAYPEYDYPQIIERSPGVVDLDENQQTYVTVVAPPNNPERAIRWVAPYLDPFKGVWMTSCVGPAYDGDRYLGAVGIDVLMTVISDRVLRTKVGSHGYAFLLSAAGTLLAIPANAHDDALWDPSHRKALLELTRPPAQQRWTHDMVEAIANTKLQSSPNAELRSVVTSMTAGETGLRTVVLGGVPKLVSYARVRQTGWSLAVVTPVDEVVAPSAEVNRLLNEAVRGALRDYVLLGLFGITISIAVGMLLHGRVIRPLGEFTQSVAAIRWENLKFSMPAWRRRGEIGLLYNKFDDMLQLIRGARDELTVQREALEEANARLLTANEALEQEVEVRREAEAALAKEKELLTVTLSSIGDGVIATDTAGNIALLNRVASELTGWPLSDATGARLSDVYRIEREGTGQPVSDPVKRALEAGCVVEFENHTVLVARDGTRRSIADSAAPIRDEVDDLKGVVLVFRDVTEKQRLEDALITAQKMETVRVLAAGIAHDFNNLLTSIVGNLSLLRLLASRGESVAERLDDAEKAALRARDLTKQLLTFSSGGAPLRKPIALSRVLRDTSRFALRGSNVNCAFVLPDDLWPVLADEGQIGQVIQNLVINAGQAMPEGGTVQVEACNRVVGPTEGLPIPAGRYVEVRVRDEGVGIPEQELPKVFQPFFTTKAQGTGLGLAVCFSIMRRHDGHIEAQSEVGRGTTVRFWLPAAVEPEQGEQEPPLSARGGSGRILLMDDDEMIRGTASAMIGALGYEVVAVADGQAAVKAYQQAVEQGRRFGLVVLDLTVPGGKGGLEALKELREFDPAVRAVVASGYATGPVLADASGYGFCASIAKPYDLDTLGEVIATALRRPQGL